MEAFKNCTILWIFIVLVGSVLISGGSSTLNLHTNLKENQLTWVLNDIVCFTALGWGIKDKIRLTDVSVITLHPGKMTNSRRTHPVPQLKCVGGSAGCSAFTPSVVQCYNRGSDGYDVQWECKTDMDSQYKFGEITVSCEGYDYPDDPYILKGSCGLEYTIDMVSSGSYYHNNYHSGHKDNTYHNYNSHSYRSSELFSKLGVLDIFQVNTFEIAKFMFYCRNNLLPPLLLNLFATKSQIHFHNYGTRTASNYRTHLCRTNLKQFTILYQGPKIWNSLPVSITHSSNLLSWLSTIITWGVIAWIVYYIYQRFTYNQSQQYPTFITCNVLCFSLTRNILGIIQLVVIINFPVPHLLDFGLSIHQVPPLGDFWDICLEAQAVAILTMITMITMVRDTISEDLGTVLVEDQAGLGPTTAGLQDAPQVGPQATITEEVPLQALGPPQDSVEPNVAKN
ncbi:hypothetical protein pdam_00002234 [Pocillopora damicornis]|uniref:Store-operated calcium entry-associated regulatory factor n=1 Tax=Pocillopora damicornis TaxID=46731 RepID=A0A3M6TFG3_POCDA|nr:hypothetical protein pdam_00002234 [Pocillopora damicornis]